MLGNVRSVRSLLARAQRLLGLNGTPRSRVLAAVLALLVVLVVGGIPGERLLPTVVELVAPPVPADTPGRDAALVVTLHDETGGGAGPGARVRAFAILAGKAYLAGEAVAGNDGVARLDGLPRAEHWIVAEAPGRARASSHVVLTAGPRDLDMSLGAEHRLEVTVRDERGEVVSGAEVEVTGKDPLPFGARVDGGGAAAVRRLGEGPWAVVARAPGYEDATARGVKDGDRPTLTLRKLGGLVVRVIGWDDSFVPGAKVMIAGPTLWPSRVAETEKDGAVRISGLASGSYALRATFGQDCSAIEIGVMLTRGEEKIVTLHLGPCRMVAARVMDGEGDDAHPIEGARVSLVEAGLSPFPVEGHTDKDGRVRLGPIAVGPSYLAARADGFVPRGSVAVPEPLPPEVVVPLVRAGALNGRVVDARGFPIDGATIEIIGTDFYGAPIDDDPRRSSFREAHFEATVSGPTTLVPAGELGVVPGPVPPIPHVFGGGGASISGASPAPTPYASLDEPWVTRDDGTFTARPASPGRIRALVRHPQYVEAMSDVVSLATGGEATVDVVMHEGGTLEGRVVSAAHDFPVAGARVILEATHGTLERTTSTATDGTFAFASVPDAVTLAVARDDESPQIAARLEVSVPEGGRKEITITLPEPRDPLPARVLDDREFPVKNAQITVHSLDPAIPFRATVFTDEHGEATLSDAKGLPLRVQISAPTFAPAQLTLDATAAELKVALARAESATGEVVAARGRDPIEGAEVVLYTDLGARHLRTGADGTFSVDGLAPGDARLVVRKAGYAPAARSLKVPATGGDRPYEIPRVELAEQGVVEGVVVDGHGDPVQGARVAKDRVPTYLAAGATPPGVAVTAPDGTFSLAELPEGTLTLEAYAPDVGRTRVDDVKVIAGRTTVGVRIQLAPDEGAREHSPASTGGVAVTLGETSAPREVVVVAVAEASEAERAGLLPNDTLVAVDGTPVHTIEEARAKLNGPVGDDVVLTIRRAAGGTTERVRVSRERVRR
jgi:hypothetical protein